MNNKEVLVDSSFFSRLSSDGRNIDDFKKILGEFDWVPVLHPYIAEHEMDVFPYFTQLICEGYVRKADYNEFIKEESDRKLYEGYFIDVYEELRVCLNAKGGIKKIEKIPVGQDIYSYRKAGMSVGDVHIILMAIFVGIPIILTEDSDIRLLRSIAKRYINSETNQYDLKIYNCTDVIKQIARKSNTEMSKKELHQILKNIGKKDQYLDISQIWEESHNSKDS